MQCAQVNTGGANSKEEGENGYQETKSTYITMC